MTSALAMKKQKFRRSIVPFTLAIGFAGYVVCLSLAVSSSGRAAPMVATLDLRENVRDLGNISSGHECRVPFRIGNTGTRRLVIHEVDTCCRNVDQGRRTVIVGPGEAVDVTVMLDTRWANGPIEQTASFTSSDPAHPRFDLTVHAWVDAEETASGSEAGHQKRKSVLIGHKR